MSSRQAILAGGIFISMVVGALVSDQVTAGVNGDGNLDAVFANINLDETNRACLGDGSGGFGCSDAGVDTGPSRKVELGDLNGDGDVDAVFANEGAENSACLGDGAGGFTCSNVSADSLLSLDVATGYVNFDGFLDAVFANMDSTNRVCLGNGSGGFTCSDAGAGSAITQGVALGHINGDSILDAMFANGDLASTVCLGDGSAGFSCSNVREETASSVDVALGDINADGDLDAILINSDTMSWICLGDGAGSFQCSDFVEETGNGRAVALGDLNRDGHLDAVLAMSGEPNRACLGDSSGNFTCSEMDNDDLFSFDVRLGDVNRDGNLDAVFANVGWRNWVCLGDGAGLFDCSEISTDTNNSWGVALAGDVPPPSLSLSKTSTTRMVRESGQVVDYRYVVRNLGPITAHDVAIADDNVDSAPVCAFGGNDELLPAGAPGSIVACNAQYTATAQEIEAGGTLDNSATATSDETAAVMAGLSIPIGISIDGFEGPACPCWSLDDIATLPLVGEEADCVSDATRIDLAQTTGCEYSYTATFSELGSTCMVQRFDCPELINIQVEVDIDDGQFFNCLEQIVTRCEDLGIEPPPFP